MSCFSIVRLPAYFALGGALLLACSVGPLDAPPPVDASAPPPPPPSPSLDGGASENVWDLVRDYGMVAEDAKPAMDRALAAAAAHLASAPETSLVLFIPAGTWTFHHPTTPAIDVAGLRAGRLVIRGAGADQTALVFDQFDQFGVLLTNAHGVTLESVHLTRPGIYTTQGDVTAVTPGRIRFAVHPGFPDPIPLVEAKNALDNDRTLIRFRGSLSDPELAPNSVSYKMCPGKGGDRCEHPILDLGGGNYEAILEDPAELADLAVGDSVALKAKAGSQTLRAEDCDDLTVRDVLFTRHAAVSLSVQGASNRTLIERVRIERAPAIGGRVPFFSGPGGGPQVTADRDGPTIRGCLIVGTTDDAVAVFSNDARAPMRGARIEGNTIRDGQGRGINITQSSDGECVGNTIIRCQNPSIQLKSNQTAEGTQASVVRWTVSRNRFVQPWTDPTIFLTQENSVTTSGRHDEIDIGFNIIEQAAKNNPFLHVRNTDDVRVHDNVIESFSDEEDVRGKSLPRPPEPMPLVFVEDAAAVSGAGNLCKVATLRPAFTADPKNAGTVVLSWATSP